MEIRRIDRTTTAHAVRFIESWSIDDVYDRFGSTGTAGQLWLAEQLTRYTRAAFVAVNARGVVGLLDHVEANGATHVGIVVDRQFRKRRIGTMLVCALLESPSAARPVIAECGKRNHAAIALLRACRFAFIESDPYQVTWRHD